MPVRLRRSSGEVEDQRIGGLGGGCQRCLCPRALGVRDRLLLVGQAPLPGGKAGEHDRDDQAGAGCRQNAPPARALHRAAAEIGIERAYDERAHGHGDVLAEALVELRRARDQGRRGRQEVRFLASRPCPSATILSASTPR